MNRHQFLAALHQRVRPRTYLETGVHRGESLTLSHAQSIGVDPDFIQADRIRDESGCVRRYERTFLRPLLPEKGHDPSA